MPLHPIKSRNALYTTLGNVPFEDGDDLPENKSTSGNLSSLKISTASPTDATLNRSVWLRSIFYQTHKAFVHKEEDRATGDDLGVTGEPTTTKFVTVEQLPDVVLGTNDFAVTTAPIDLTTPVSNSLLEVVTDPTGQHKTKTVRFSDSGWKWLKESLKQEPYTPGVGVSVLVVNSTNVNVGTGSFSDPYKTIDSAVDWINAEVTTAGSFPTLRDRRASYTIIVLGGDYTTSKNLSIGVGWYFFPNSTVEWEEDLTRPTIKHAWDANETGFQYPIRIGGYLRFTSTDGGCLNSFATTTPGIGQVVLEFDSISTTYSSLYDVVINRNPIGLLEINSYNQGHVIKGNHLSTLTCAAIVFGRNSVTSVTGIEIGTLAGCSYIINVAVLIQFVNTYLIYDVQGSFKFTCPASGQLANLELRNCDLGTNTDGTVYIIRCIAGSVLNANTFILFNNVRLKHGNDANGGAGKTLLRNDMTTVSVMTITLDFVNLSKPTALTLSSGTGPVVYLNGPSTISDIALSTNGTTVSGNTIIILPNGVFSYATKIN